MRYQRPLNFFPFLLLLSQPSWSEPRRHDYLPPAQLARFQTQRQSHLELGEGVLPAAIHRGGARLSAPKEQPPKHSILRPSQVRPDRRTEADSALKYRALFNPSVIPYRRDAAFDLVTNKGELSIRDPRPRPISIPVKPPQAQLGRELFWGTFGLNLQPGRWQAISSVAPDMRILAAESVPPVLLSFAKDSAGNFSVSAPHRGFLELRILLDVDGGYFAEPPSENVALNLQRDHPSAALPPSLRAKAQVVLERLKIQPEGPFNRELARIIAWFRAFEAGVSPKGDDLYLALALGQRGVCRHRAFSFVITARAAGVPSRYLQNEAHAFAEILAPDGRWRRVDLGGEAPRLDLEMGAQQGLHRPDPDPYPKPPPYQRQYSQSAPGSQLGEGQRSGERSALRSSTAKQKIEERGSGPSNRASGLLGEAQAEIPIPAVMAEPNSLPKAQARAVELRLALPWRKLQVYRGEALREIQGQLKDVLSRSPLSGVRVQVFLLPQDGGRPIAIGSPVFTESEGRFKLQPRLPSALPLGSYTLLAVSEAGPEHRSGRSDESGE